MNTLAENGPAAAGPGFGAPPPLGLYVHLPWCIRKCPYCDFNSHGLDRVADGEVPEQAYVDALLADLELELPLVWGRRVSSVFIGGGTPSLFSPRSIHRLLSGLRARLEFRPQVEVTLEANPGAADSARLAGFVEAGVNRFSIGVQSFDDAMLGALGRVHDAGAARQAVEAALASGASRVNIDLMFGLPRQSPESAARDVAAACASGVDHVSYYQLTLEPNTAFFRSPPPLPEHDAVFDMYSAGSEALASHGYQRYEVSAYARAGSACQHNLNYWRFGDYLGIGAGAHGKITLAAEARVLRSVKQRHPRQYLLAVSRGEPSLRRAPVAVADLPFEFVLNALRLSEGFDLGSFEARTGLPRSRLQPQLEQARAEGLLRVAGDRVRASAHGARFLDDLVARFLPDGGAG